jgi:hypothetical protein
MTCNEVSQVVEVEYDTLMVYDTELGDEAFSLKFQRNEDRHPISALLHIQKFLTKIWLRDDTKPLYDICFIKCLR